MVIMMLVVMKKKVKVSKVRKESRVSSYLLLFGLAFAFAFPLFDNIGGMRGIICHLTENHYEIMVGFERKSSRKTTNFVHHGLLRISEKKKERRQILNEASGIGILYETHNWFMHAITKKIIDEQIFLFCFGFRQQWFT